MKYSDLKNKKRSRSKGSSGKKSQKEFPLARYCFIFLFFIVVAGLFILLLSDKARALFDPVTLVASINRSDLLETDGRTNVMILGSDRRADELEVAPERADTILVASFGRLDGNLVLISIPRDLWVESPVCGRCKITEVYAYAANSPSPEEELQKVIENVLGMDIHYYGVINFALFQDIIDTLGGVTIDVENAFDDYLYPIEGMENALCGKTQEEIEELLCTGRNLVSEADEVAELEEVSEEDREDALECLSPLQVVPCRYEHIRFEAGSQEMDGERALKYVRSRHASGHEGTDFARAARQQKVIMAVKNKATSLNTLLNPRKIQELYSLYKDTVITNVDFNTLQEFYLLSQNVDFSEIRAIVLDDRSAANQGGLLYSPIDTSLYGGKYVLLPRAGNYSQIHAYVQRFLFGE